MTTGKACIFALAGSAVCALGARTARADVAVTVEDGDAVPAWSAPVLASGIGIGLTVGGGIDGFAGHTMREATAALGGTWDVRAAFGTALPLCLETSYVGSATTIGAQIGKGTGTLLGTTLEGDLRVNLMPQLIIDPFVFAGVGWQRYSVQNSSFSLAMSGVASADDMWEIPVGGGIAYRVGGLVAEVRGTFRSVRDENLVAEMPASGGRVQAGVPAYAPMHSWEASLNFGFEF